MSSYIRRKYDGGRWLSSRGQRKYRRNIFLKLRALGYTTKDELRPFLPAIRQAVWNKMPFQYPVSLIQLHHQAMGEAKARKKQAEAAAAKEKLRRERFSMSDRSYTPRTGFRWTPDSWF